MTYTPSYIHDLYAFLYVRECDSHLSVSVLDEILHDKSTCSCTRSLEMHSALRNTRRRKPAIFLVLCAFLAFSSFLIFLTAMAIVLISSRLLFVCMEQSNSSRNQGAKKTITRLDVQQRRGSKSEMNDRNEHPVGSGRRFGRRAKERAGRVPRIRSFSVVYFSFREAESVISSS